MTAPRCFPPFSTPCTLALAAVLCALGAPAAAAAADSRITEVRLYPGSATVERAARVAAGSRSITFACLPAGLDVQSIQLSAGASVQLGESAVLTEPRALSARCGNSELDARIRTLEDRKAALQAESDALGLVTGYLKGFAAGADTGKQPLPDARGLVAVADAMRRTGQDALDKQHQLQRRQGDLDRDLAPLLAERNRAQGARGDQVTAVSVNLATNADAEVRLSYQVAGPGWTPSYRALLDTQSRRVRIERQALVAQATGEDWRGVKLVLSTGQPRRETAGRLPTPWRIGIEPPPRPHDERSALSPAAPMAAMSADTAKMRRAEAPLFDATVFDGAFVTEFSLPQAIDVPSNGQRVAVVLGQHEASAALAVRTSPLVDPSAFLVAELTRPEGVWPAGPLALYRDNAFVGHGRWDSASEGADARLTLSFGRDEQVHVRVEPERDNKGSGGFGGTRAERRMQRAYTIENRHRIPMAVQVVEAAPVAVDDQVRVTTAFAPQPAELAWREQPGVALWRFELPAGQSARVAADYTISYPKDARLAVR